MERDIGDILTILRRQVEILAQLNEEIVKIGIETASKEIRENTKIDSVYDRSD